MAEFLFNNRPTEILINIEEQSPFEVEEFTFSKDDKLEVIKKYFPTFNELEIFPFHGNLSAIFNKHDLILSMLSQPFVWIKVRAKDADMPSSELWSNKISFEKHSDTIWKFPPDVKLTELKSYRKGYFRVQDLSTQESSEYFQAKTNEIWWDCCAGAGGKSLALLENSNKIKLYASDTRQNILENYVTRLDKYNYKATKVFRTDLEIETPEGIPMMDGIIADVPCSGSGTWARSPENLVNFENDKLNEYIERQAAILKNTLPLLKVNRPIIYITCSVFAQENEKQIKNFVSAYPVKIEFQKYIEGYQHGAENIFVCRMIKLK